MLAIFSKIEAIELKIRKLIHKNEKLAAENKLLLEENIKIKKELQAIFSKPIESGKQENHDIISAFSEEEKVNSIKEELNKYIHEVNDCINILEGQT